MDLYFHEKRAEFINHHLEWVNIDPNFKMLFSYWSPFKSRLSFTHSHGKDTIFELALLLAFTATYFQILKIVTISYVNIGA